LTLLLSALGGVLALDATSLGQFMISRPLVAGVFTGSILGNPAMGLEVGVILELFHVAGMPAGGSRVPDAGPASVAAVAVAASAGGLVVSDLGGMTVGVHRHLSAILIGRVEVGLARPVHLDVAHLSLIALDFLRGATVTGLAILAGRWMVGASASWWTVGYGSTVGILLVGVSIHLGALLRGFGGWRSRRVLFMVGAVAGMIGTYLS